MGRKSSYEIKLKEEEKQALIDITGKGKHPARGISTSLNSRGTLGTES